MNAQAKPAQRKVDAAIEALMPIVHSEVSKRMRGLPANIERDDLLQVGRLAAWEAVTKFDGRGNIESYARKLLRDRLTDHLRTTFPAGGRNGNLVRLVSDQDVDLDARHEGGDPTAEAAEAKEHLQAQLGALSPKLRAVALATLAGQSGIEIAAKRGVTPSRVCQQLRDVAESCASGKAARKTPASFDPDAVPLYIGKPVPPVDRKQMSKFRRLVELTPATGSRVLGTVQANSFISELKRAGLRWCKREVSSTTVEVWREPSPEQLKGSK